MDNVTPRFVLTAREGSSAVLQQKLRLMLDSTGEGIFGIDLEGHRVLINWAGLD